MVSECLAIFRVDNLTVKGGPNPGPRYPASAAQPPPHPPSTGAASSHPVSRQSLSLSFFTWCRRFIDEAAGRRGCSGGKRGDREGRGWRWGGEGTTADLKARLAASCVREARVLQVAMVGRGRTRVDGPPNDVITCCGSSRDERNRGGTVSGYKNLVVYDEPMDLSKNNMSP
jgi:hypothetical protein